MKGFRTLLFTCAYFALPLTTFAAGGKFTGALIPSECRCAGAWGCVLQVFQNVINFGVYMGVIIIVLIIAYAGAMMVIYSTNASKRKAGRAALFNAVTGLVILLCSWLIVDFVMKAVYDDKGSFGPWNSILGSGSTSKCITSTDQAAITDGVVDIITGTPVYSTTGPGGTIGGFSFQTPSISAQQKDASGQLSRLLSCMSSKVPAGVGKISSVSDSAIASKSKTFQQCVVSGCAHAKNSCHYGGTKCTGSSFAVDFGDQQNTAVLTAAAKACGASAIYDEGNHLHVSVGGAAGCGCN